MDQSPLYASQGFGKGGGSSCVVGLGNGGRMRPRRRRGWRRGCQRRVTLASSNQTRSAVICFRMPVRTEGTAYSVIGGGVLCWWRNTLFLAEAEAKS